MLVTGKDDQEYLEILLECLSKTGLCLKKSKCSFMMSSVQYLGHRIDSKGLCAAKDKFKPILLGQLDQKINSSYEHSSAW